MAKRNLYLNNTPVDEALAAYMKALEGDVKPVREEIRAEESLNRVTAEAVYAKYCSPLFNAAAMGLDFIEVGPEEYDFAIPVRFLSLPHVKRFLETLGSSEFRKRVEQLGGYGTSKTGQILYLDEVKR